MFVYRLVQAGLLIPMLAFIVNCSGSGDTTAEEKFQSPSSTCGSFAIKNKFIVHWKNGDMTFESAVDREKFVNEFMTENNEEIAWAEHDYKLKQFNPVTSPIASSEVTEFDWGQQKIQVEDVWARGIDGSGVLVAVIDSGVDIDHPQLANQIYRNPREFENGIDDDGNGLIDDISGYDFERDRPQVTDGTGHGTHVSGIVGASHSNGNIKGIAYGAKILPLDFMNSEGEGSLSDAVSALNYAADQGARVINASWGGAPCSESLGAAINGLNQKGILVVVASGNNGQNLDVRPEFPAAYTYSNQITVGASSPNDFTADFSNYSGALVDIVAPGVSIYSTYTFPSERYLDGTSMAAPFVSGAAALLFSHRPSATVQQVKEALLFSVDSGPFPVATRGRLNIKKAIEYIETVVQ